MKSLIFAAAFVLGICFSAALNAQDTKYVIVNQTGMPISTIYVEPSGTTVWKSNVYTLKDPIPINATYEFTRVIDPAVCTYDIKYIDINGHEYYTKSVNLCSNTELKLVGQFMKSVTILNNTGLNITAFYIAPPNTTYWSNNLSARDKIYPGETFAFLQQLDNTACIYDVRLDADNGNSYILKGYNLCVNENVAFVLPK
jgi:hypothetical protein